MVDTLPSRTSRGFGPILSREPFATLRDEIDTLLRRFSGEPDGGGLGGEFLPVLDVAETDGAVTVTMDLPGVKPEEINIEVTGSTLRISGERQEEREEKGKSFHRVERRSGRFVRAITLPCPVQEEQVEAKYEDGVLRIELPKTEEAKPRKIEVKSKRE